MFLPIIRTARVFCTLIFIFHFTSQHWRLSSPICSTLEAWVCLFLLAGQNCRKIGQVSSCCLRNIIKADIQVWCQDCSPACSLLSCKRLVLFPTQPFWKVCFHHPIDYAVMPDFVISQPLEELSLWSSLGLFVLYYPQELVVRT